MSLDAIDMTTAVIAPTDCPDIRAWPLMAPITRVHLADREVYVRGNVSVEFVGRDQLPPATPPGWASGIAYTLWMGLWRQGSWVFAPIVECIEQYVPTGYLFAPQQVAENLLYYPMHAALHKVQPAPGERVAWLCTTGNTRRMNVQAGPARRTPVVVTPFAVGDYRFDASTVTPLPPTQPGTAPTPPGNELQAALAQALARVDALERADGAHRQELAEALASVYNRLAILEARPVTAVPALPASVRIYGVRVPVTWG